MAIDREDTLRKAEKLLRQGRLAAAIAAYQQVADAYPQDWTTANVLGDCLHRANQIDSAVAQYNRTADHLAGEGFYPKAAALYKKILKIAPQNDHALSQLAEMARQQGILVEARQTLAALAEGRRTRGDARGRVEVLLRIGGLDPEDLAARLASARAAGGLGGDDLVARELRDVAAAFIADGRSEAAIETLEEALRLVPGDPETRTSLARTLAAGGDAVRAREHVETASELRELAEIASGTGHRDCALGLLEEALRLAPDDTQVVLRLLQEYVGAGDVPRAIAALDALGRIDAPDVLEVAGDLRARAGQPDEARALFARLLAREPHRIEAVLSQGLAAAEAEPQVGLVHVEAAAAARLARGDSRGAVGALAALVERQPAHEPALVRLLEVANAAGDAEAAARAERHLRDLYLAAGRGHQAVQLAEQIVSRRPDDAGAIERLRQALIAIGEPHVDERIAVLTAGSVARGRVDGAEPRPESGLAGTGQRDPFGLGPIAIDLHDILGETGGEAGAASTVNEGGEVDLSDALDRLVGGAQEETVQPPSESGGAATLEQVFEDFREEVSRQSAAGAAEQHYKLALAYRDVGMLADAMRELKVAVRSPRLRFEAGALLARLALERGQDSEAIEWFERAAEAPAPTVDAGRELLYDLAATLEARGEPARALAVFIELQADAQDYRDVARRVERLARDRAQTGD